MRNELYFLKFLLGFAFLVYASKLDLEKREVPNRIWKYMILTISPLTAIEIFLFDQIYLAAFQAVFVISLALLFYYLGFYGGADAKALIALAILYPIYPDLYQFPLFKGFSFAFSTLFNAVIFAPIISLFFFIRNLIRNGIGDMRNNALYYFIGLKKDVDKIPKHYSLLEFIDDSGKLIRAKRGVVADKKMIERLKKAKVDSVWVTPQIPFIVFITIGYLISFFAGSPIEYFLRHFLYSSP